MKKAMKNREVISCIVVRHQIYAGTCGIDGHAYILSKNDVDGDTRGAKACAPRLWENAAEAQKWINEREGEIYVTRSGEAGRPDYWIVPEYAAAVLQSRSDDGSLYDWPEAIDGCDDGACGQCDACVEWMADQDDEYLKSVQIKEIER